MEGTGFVAVEVPVEERGLGEAVFEEAEAGDGGGPSPAGVAGEENADLEDVAGFRAVDVDGAGEGVDAGTVDAEVIGGGHAGDDLAAGSIGALELDFVAGVDDEAGLEGVVPEGVGGFGGEDVLGHGSTSRARTAIWTSTMALRGRALTPTAARTCLPASPRSRTRRSDAPLMTAGESSKPGTALT